MSRIKDLDMAPALSSHPDINIQSLFFGLVEKDIYTPTGSRLTGHIYEYSPFNGERLHQMLDGKIEQIEKVVTQGSFPVAVPVGNIRAEVCRSDDHQFVAIQLLHFADFEYKPLCEMKYFKGHDAELVSRLFER